MPITVRALPVALSEGAERIWLDTEGGAPLRCCLRDSRPGERVALVSVTPPGPRGPCAETGPVFLHADSCTGPSSEEYPPDWMLRRQVLRSYDEGGSIIGGTLVEAGDDHVAAAERLLADPSVAFLQTRNVVHGCYMLTIRRS